MTNYFLGLVHGIHRKLAGLKYLYWPKLVMHLNENTSIVFEDLPAINCLFDVSPVKLLFLESNSNVVYPYYLYIVLMTKREAKKLSSRCGRT